MRGSVCSHRVVCSDPAVDKWGVRLVRASCDALEAGSCEDQHGDCLWVYNPSGLPCDIDLAVHWQSCILVEFARDASVVLAVEGVGRNNRTRVAWVAPSEVEGHNVWVGGAAVVADGDVGVVIYVTLGWMHHRT